MSYDICLSLSGLLHSVGQSLGGPVVKAELPLHGVGVQSLVGELRSCMPHDTAKKKKREKEREREREREPIQYDALRKGVLRKLKSSSAPLFPSLFPTSTEGIK